MPSDEDVISLIVQRHHSPALQLRLRRIQILEQVRREETQRRAEVVEDEFGYVASGVSVPGQLLAFHPVRNGEVEVRSRRKVDDVEASGLLLVHVLHEDDEGGIGARGGEGSDLADGVFVCASVCCAPDWRKLVFVFNAVSSGAS